MLFFFKKVLAVQKKVVILHRICGELSCGVTVAHRILVPFAWVRILPGQPREVTKSGHFLFEKKTILLTAVALRVGPAAQNKTY